MSTAVRSGSCRQSASATNARTNSIPGEPLSVPPDEPPPTVTYDLEGALGLLAALEDARDALTDSDHLAVLAELEQEIATLSRRLGFDQGDTDGR